jgi:hypothetical protein
MGAAICHLIDGCGAAVRLCGHSYGGNVALHAAIARPRSVQSPVLFEPVFFRALNLAGEQQALEPAVGCFSTYADRLERGEAAAVAEMIDYWFGAGSFARMHPSARSFVIAGAARNDRDVCATLAERLTVEQLSSFNNPVLAAYGGACPPTAQAIATALVGLLPRARRHVIPGAGMLDSAGRSHSHRRRGGGLSAASFKRVLRQPPRRYLALDARPGHPIGTWSGRCVELAVWVAEAQLGQHSWGVEPPIRPRLHGALGNEMTRAS